MTEFVATKPGLPGVGLSAGAARRFTGRRHCCVAIASMSLVRWAPARAGESPIVVSIAFDRLYIPPLFLTGRAAGSPEAADRARAAMGRLEAQWPALRQRFLACWPSDKPWAAVLAKLALDLTGARRAIDARDWSGAHEALEPMRERLHQARVARAVDYPLDRYTTFHGSMEHLFDRGAALKDRAIGEADRRALTADFARARAHWQAVERASIDPQAHGLNATRVAQWRAALRDETNALTTVSQALGGTDDASVLKAIAAIKAPFVRAYTAFGEG